MSIALPITRAGRAVPATVGSLAVAGTAFGIAAIAHGDLRAQTTSIAVATVVAGCSFAAAGTIALVRDPRRSAGLLLGLTGLLLLASSMAQTNTAVPFTLGLLVAAAPPAVLAHLVLRFPEDRLRSRLERALIVLAYVNVTLLQAAMLMFMGDEHMAHCPCPDNLLFVRHDEGVHTALMNAERVLGIVVAGTVVALVLRRWWHASSPMRRAINPLVVSGGLWCLLLLLDLLLNGPTPLVTAERIAFAAIPIAYLFGLLRTTLGRSPLTGLLADLGGPLAPGTLRDAIARALRDPSLRIAYWIPERTAYVDVSGRPVDVAGSDAVTPIERDGRRIGALLHDTALVEDRALLNAVAGAASIALDNERLQADLRANVRELQASRARIVEAGDAARRRLERNLHDGAQQRLVSVSVALSLVAQRLAKGDSEPASIVLESTRAELAEALAELRELARGLHPAVVSRGLEAALSGLADRAPLPVELDIEPGEDPPEAVTATAYYVVAEALTNVARYAGATRARVAARSADGVVELTVSDDGRGGARLRPGSGLEGLADRVAAVGGTFAVDSSPGAGTRITARIPLS